MGRGCDPRGRPYTTFRDAIVQKRSKAQKRRKNEVINFLYLTISKISTKNLKIMNPINEIMHLKSFTVGFDMENRMQCESAQNRPRPQQSVARPSRCIAG